MFAKNNQISPENHGLGHGTSRLHIVSSMVNAQKYISVLQTRLLLQIKDWQSENNWIFQQDSAPCHTAKVVKLWIAMNEVKVLPWAGNSPDMNPIENLWELLKKVCI